VNWKPYTHHGQVFDLSHLDDFEHTYLEPTKDNRQNPYLVKISFSNHCFTDSSNDDQGLVYAGTDSSQRYFNTQRWQYSQLLPKLVTELHQGWVYVVNDNSYFTYRTFDEYNRMLEYDIFFDVFFDKAIRQIVLLVKSAYPRDSLESQHPRIDNRNKVRLFKLLSAAKTGKRVHRQY
jgi:hypothetical protein